MTQWQPQFEWLKENAASGFSKITELMQDAAAGVRGELSGLAEQAKTAQATAGQHSLKAQAAAKDAESVATRIVDAAIAKLKGNAPAMLDTLEELAERVKSGGSLESEIIQKLSKMADSETVKNIVARLDGLTIAGVQGLSAALASKAGVKHPHDIKDVSGLDDIISNIKGELRGKLGESDFPTMLKIDTTFRTMQSNIRSTERRVSTAEASLSSVQSTASSTARSLEAVQQDLSEKVNRNEITNMVTGLSGIKQIAVVSQKPARPVYGTLYLVQE